MSNRFQVDGEHRHRQTKMVYAYAARYVVDGRDVTWWAQVKRSGKQWSLSGGGLELPEEDAGTGLGMNALEIVRHDIGRAIDNLG